VTCGKSSRALSWGQDGVPGTLCSFLVFFLSSPNLTPTCPNVGHLHRALPAGWAAQPALGPDCAKHFLAVFPSTMEGGLCLLPRSQTFILSASCLPFPVYENNIKAEACESDLLDEFLKFFLKQF
jgi:hypothetical protein